jgi:hypothetical protein
VELLEQSGTRLSTLAEAARIPLESLNAVVAAGRGDKPRLTVGGLGLEDGTEPARPGVSGLVAPS